MPKLTRNPNAAKRHLTHNVTSVGASTTSPGRRSVKRSYLPGKTIDARIAGIQNYYRRQARLGRLA